MPTQTQTKAATTVMEASNDPGWGMFVWLALTAGIRSERLCALRWDNIDLQGGVIRAGSDQGNGQAYAVPLAPQTIPLLSAYQAHCAAQAAILGFERRPRAFVFSPAPDGGIAPDHGAIAQRFADMCADLGWDADLDHLPHCSVDDLVAGGVDVLAVTWRLKRGLSRIQRRPKA